MSDGVDFRNRLLLWHKVLAQMTGTLSLSFGGKGVRRAALVDWAQRLRTVADDIDSITGVETSKLDKAGRDVLVYAGRTALLSSEDGRSEPGLATKETHHDEDVVQRQQKPHRPHIERTDSDNKKSVTNSGLTGKVGPKPLRKATRR